MGRIDSIVGRTLVLHKVYPVLSLESALNTAWCGPKQSLIYTAGRILTAVPWLLGNSLLCVSSLSLIVSPSPPLRDKYVFLSTENPELPH